MDSQFSRTELMFGSGAMQALKSARILVFGVGGVGSYAVEALARSGIGALCIVDSDTVALSNINRQLCALHSTLGRPKVDVVAERIKDINPLCSVTARREFFLPETASSFDFSLYDYVIDCIDTVSGKIQIVLQAKEAGVKVISSMGAGNKLDPTKFRVADIYETSVCPLAKVMRHELKKRGISSLKVVFSTEPALKVQNALEGQSFASETDSGIKKIPPGSNPFVPSVAGLIIAGEVIKDIAGL